MYENLHTHFIVNKMIYFMSSRNIRHGVATTIHQTKWQKNRYFLVNFADKHNDTKSYTRK